jgi:hypothetical protein
LPTVEVLEEEGGRVLGLRVSGGRSGAEDLAGLTRRAREIVERRGTLRLLVLLERIGMLEALSLRSRLASVVDLSPHVERVAVVGDQGWLRKALAAAPKTVTERVRIFPPADLDVARSWISAP